VALRLIQDPRTLSWSFLIAASRAEFRFFERPLTFRRRDDQVSLCNVPRTRCSILPHRPCVRKHVTGRSFLPPLSQPVHSIDATSGHHPLAGSAPRTGGNQVKMETCSVQHRISLIEVWTWTWNLSIQAPRYPHHRY
jgi:hypothetical protein